VWLLLLLVANLPVNQFVDASGDQTHQVNRS
jgi:hypothetical protein